MIVKWTLTLLLIVISPAAGIMIENSLWVIKFTNQRATAFSYNKSLPSLVLYNTAGTGDCSTPSDIWQATPTAVVGSLFSYFESMEEYCGTHPYINREFRTIDMKTNKSVNILDVFGEVGVFKALSADPFIRKTTGKNKVYPNLSALIKFYNDNNKDCLKITDDTLRSFSFYDYSLFDHRTAIRLSLSIKFSDCNPGFTQLGLWISTPDKLKVSLAEAKRRGNLMRYIKNYTTYPLK